MKRSNLKKIIKEELKKLQKQMLNEVYVPCCDEDSGSWQPDCCWKTRKECCNLDKQHGMGASGCCENIRPNDGGAQDMEDIMLERKRNLLKEGTVNCCVKDWESKCCTDLEALCCKNNLPCCDNDELFGDEEMTGGPVDPQTGTGPFGGEVPGERLNEYGKFMPNPAFRSRMEKGFVKFGCSFLHNRLYSFAGKLNAPGKGPKWMIMLRNKIAILRDVAVSNGCGNLPLNV